jgi:hypothetical protein
MNKGKKTRGVIKKELFFTDKELDRLEERMKEFRKTFKFSF